MARFELDDGHLHKFWEVVLEADVLTFRYGDIGTAGRTRSKAHRSERRAKAAYDEAVRAMIAQGYRRVVDVPDTPEPEAAPMWPRLEEDPDDREALAIHADWLQSRGDVRGEVLALGLAGLEAEAEALRLAHRAELYGPIDDFPGRVEHDWRWGYVRSIRLDPSDHRGVDPAGAAVAILGSESLRLLQELDLAVPAAAQVAVARKLPALWSLALHTGVVGSDFQPSEPLDLDRLAEAMPRLRVLRVRGVSALSGAAVLAGLGKLDLRFAPGWVERILRHGAGLAELGIHGVDAPSTERLASAGAFEGLEQLSLTPSWNAAPVLIAALTAGPCAKRLVLSGVELERTHVRVLESIRGLEQLVCDGTLSPGAHQALAESRLELVGQVRLRPDELDDDDEPERPRDLKVQRLEYHGGTRRRYFWEIGLDGSVHHIRYGRIGTRGRWIWRRFPSEDIAEEILERRVEEKLKDGYRPTRMRVVYDASATD